MKRRPTEAVDRAGSGRFSGWNLRESGRAVVDALGDISAPDRADSGGVRSIRLRIPAKAEYITLCRLALTGLAQLRPVPDDTLADLKLALTEAVSNSVRHAYGPDGQGQVDI